MHRSIAQPRQRCWWRRRRSGRRLRQTINCRCQAVAPSDSRTRPVGRRSWRGQPRSNDRRGCRPRDAASSRPRHRGTAHEWLPIDDPSRRTAKADRYVHHRVDRSIPDVKALHNSITDPHIGTESAGFRINRRDCPSRRSDCTSDISELVPAAPELGAFVISVSPSTPCAGGQPLGSRPSPASPPMRSHLRKSISSGLCI